MQKNKNMNKLSIESIKKHYPMLDDKQAVLVYNIAKRYADPNFVPKNEKEKAMYELYKKDGFYGKN